MGVPRYLRFLLKPPALNVEESAWELLYLLIFPRRVYKSLYFRQQTRNQWAREDPSFVILLSALLAISAIAWGFRFSPTFLGILHLILYMVVVDFLVIGSLISTAAYFFVNKVARKHDQHSNTPLEWAFCFDVHCNSFVAIYAWLYVLQFFILPLVSGKGTASVILGNLLYYFAVSHYFVITFLGYSMLPFLSNTQLFLVPIGLMLLFTFGCTVNKVSIVRYMLKEYMSWGNT